LSGKRRGLGEHRIEHAGRVFEARQIGDLADAGELA
jgi:hypothetical protein